MTRTIGIERDFEVRIIYGRRGFMDPHGRVVVAHEVLLIDVSQFSRRQIELFKFRLWERFHLLSFQLRRS